MGHEPRQTTSNLGHLKKPSIQALIHGLGRHYYSLPINYRKNDLEQRVRMANCLFYPLSLLLSLSLSLPPSSLSLPPSLSLSLSLSPSLQMLLNLHKKMWMAGLQLSDYQGHSQENEKATKVPIPPCITRDRGVVLTAGDAGAVQGLHQGSGGREDHEQ